jgi:hypothetical protein
VPFRVLPITVKANNNGRGSRRPRDLDEIPSVRAHGDGANLGV